MLAFNTLNGYYRYIISERGNRVNSKKSKNKKNQEKTLLGPYERAVLDTDLKEKNGKIDYVQIFALRDKNLKK